MSPPPPPMLASRRSQHSTPAPQPLRKVSRFSFQRHIEHKKFSFTFPPPLLAITGVPNTANGACTHPLIYPSILCK